MKRHIQVKTLLFLTVLLVVAITNFVYAATYGEWTVSNDWTISPDWNVGGTGGIIYRRSPDIALTFALATLISPTLFVTFTVFPSVILTFVTTVLAPTGYVVPLFEWPDFASLLAGFNTAIFIYPVMIIGMVSIGLVMLYYGRADAYEYVRSAPWLLVVAAVGIVGVFVYYFVVSAIFGAFV